MSRRVVVIGAGMGGLTAALRLARHGHDVRVLEARDGPGGLAGGFTRDGLAFDAGPYILLDRPGLEWACREVGLELADLVTLRRIEDVYEVRTPGGVVRFYHDLERTATGMEAAWPGSGRRYTDFVHHTGRVYQALRPLLHISHPGPLDLLRTGAWRQAPFVLRSLRSVLERAGLPRPVMDAVAIWTHVAGQTLDEAPSPLAFVPALIHGVGAFYPAEGIAAVPRALAEAAARAGVAFQYGARVNRVRIVGGRVEGVETEAGDFVPADAVVSDAGGLGTLLDLVPETPPRERQRLEQLPLQSPGVCAYLAVKGEPRPPYLRFLLPGGGELCRLLVRPAVIAPECQVDGWQPARLIAPMQYRRAEEGGPAGQGAFLDRVLGEEWWRERLDEVRVLGSRVPAAWGADFHLYRDSMNPVMTARFMRTGRLPHRCPYVRGLYLTGSSTHPGQWVSFCAISGILAADRVCDDFR